MITMMKRQITMMAPSQSHLGGGIVNGIENLGSKKSVVFKFFKNVFSHNPTSEVGKRCNNHCNQFTPLDRKHLTGFIKKTRGQSITEYAVFITVVVMALLAMQVYLKRGIQGKIKDMISSLGSESYNPNLTYSNFSLNTSTVYETSYEDGIRTTQMLLDQTNRTGIEIVLPEGVN